MTFNAVEMYLLAVIKNQRQGIVPTLLRAGLTPLSWLFRSFVACRNWAFDCGWLRRYHPPALVISIGNIVAGGTGKTPVTLMLAKEFYGKLPLAILSRGYRSKAEKLVTPTWLSRGEGPMRSASFCGDEPFLLAQNLPKAFVIVGKNRLQASIMAAKEGAKLIFLEDGMQHRRIARDLEIVVMDSRDLYGQNHYLPRGLLREGRHALGRAHLIILNNLDPTIDFATKKAEVAPYSSALVIGTRMQVSGIYDFKGNKLDGVKGKKIALFCGISRPEYFEKTITDEGATVVATYVIPDHKSFDQQALDKFSLTCQKLGAELLLCTEKDRVRFAAPPTLSLPTAWMQMQLAIVEGVNEWNHFIEKAKKDVIK
jgi:tetraacyldisaccharide 4'-kinase